MMMIYHRSNEFHAKTIYNVSHVTHYGKRLPLQVWYEVSYLSEWTDPESEIQPIFRFFDIFMERLSYSEKMWNMYK